MMCEEAIESNARAHEESKVFDSVKARACRRELSVAHYLNESLGKKKRARATARARARETAKNAKDTKVG